MYTAMYDFKDRYNTLYCRNAKIGGYKTIKGAIKAIIRKSPMKSGDVRVGLNTVLVIKNGKELTV